MAADASNQQYSDPPFGLAGDYTSTGAGGSPGISAADTNGPVIGSPVVSAPFASSQVAANMPHLDVTSGDTSAFSDDIPVHTSPLLPGQPGDYLSTGAGDGSPEMAHPNAAGR